MHGNLQQPPTAISLPIYEIVNAYLCVAQIAGNGTCAAHILLLSVVAIGSQNGLGAFAFMLVTNRIGNGQSQSTALRERFRAQFGR
jgi:hypothetical protein